MLLRPHHVILFAFILFISLEKTSFTSSLPLGVIADVKGNEIIVESDPSIAVPQGAMVAIYGMGSLERHPLTKKIILMGAEQIARGQVESLEEGLLVARIVWKSRGAVVGPGMDVVLMAEESLTNSAPVLAGEVVEKKALVQQSVHLEIPISDPDGDFVFYQWELEGSTGGIGFLDARVTYLPKIVWFTPGTEINANLVVTATDTHNQSTTLKVPLRALETSIPWPNRELKPIGAFGAKVEFPLKTLTRDSFGRWWGSNKRSLVTISPSWRQIKSISLTSHGVLFRPITVVVHRDAVHILDAHSRSIIVIRSDGARLRSYGDFSNPTDLVIDGAGGVYVADQMAGGIFMYNVEGEFVERLGDVDGELNSFVGLTQLALNSAGDLLALDRTTKLIHRFDAQHKRLTTWPLPIQGKEFPVDLAWHPAGHVLVLLNNGRIMTITEDAQFGMSMEPVSGSYSIHDLGRPDSFFVDASGEVFVTYAESGLVARYSAKGSLTGLRGRSLWELEHFAADGTGNIYGVHKGDGKIYAFDHEGWLVKQIGGLGFNQNLLEKPVELAVEPDGSSLIVLDTDKKQIFRFVVADPSNPLLFNLPDMQGKQPHKKMKFAVDEAGRTFVLDAKSRRVSVVDKDGNSLLQFGRGNQKGFTRELQKPTLLAVHPNGKFVYIYDRYQIKKFELDYDTGIAVHVVNIGSKGYEAAQFRKPVAMACDRRGLIYVLDVGRKDLQVLNIGGKEMKEMYSRSYSDWGVERVDDMVVDPDGRVLLVSSGSLFALGW